MSKKQALTEFHRVSIMTAADRLFKVKGVDKTTMDDIAKEAEYSKATLYVYFESKEEIVNAIYLNGMQLLKKKLSDAIRGESDWRKGYDAVCGAMMRFYQENPATYDAVAGELSAADGVAEEVKGQREIKQATDQVVEIMADFLKRGEAGGIVVLERDPREVALLMWAAISGMVRMARRRGTYFRQELGVPGEDYLRHGTDFVLKAILK